MAHFPANRCRLPVSSKDILCVVTDAAVRAETAARISSLSARPTPLPIGQRYPVILADPPWRYEERSLGTPSRQIEHFYPTLSLDEICALPIGDLATRDAILFLWTTAPKCAEAMRVIEAWGFSYRTQLVWVKHSSTGAPVGVGYFVSTQHELLLIGTRGDFPHPAPADRPSSVLMAQRRAHSQKPEEAYAIIERMYPGIHPRIELFARAHRDGWHTWGNEVGAEGMGDNP
jgi:N6-adenosine-specific RNA methylase IME4